MKKTISNEAEVIRIFREEHHSRLQSLLEELDMYFEPGGNDNVISDELKVKHKKTGIRYTVDSVSARDVVLRSPEGKKIKLDQRSLEDQFELD